MVEPVNSGRLQRTVIFYAVAVMLVLSMFVAAAGIVPLYSRLRTEAQAHLAHVLELQIGAIEEYLSRAAMLALQVTSRSAIRDRLDAFNRGAEPLESLQAFSRDKLADSMNLSPEIVGVARLDAKGVRVIEIGRPIPKAGWKIPDREAGEKDVRVNPPIVLGENRYLVVAAIIRGREGEFVGTDLILFDAAGLQRIVSDRQGLGQSGETILGMRGNTGLDPFFPLRRDVAPDATDPILHSAPQPGISGPAPLFTRPAPLFENKVEAMAAAEVASTGWTLIVRMEKRELYEDIDSVLFLVVGGIAVLMSLGVVGLVVVLRPLASGILVQNADMQRQILELEEIRRALEEKTGKLERSNAELEQFAYVASHDLQEPLRTVTSYVQLLDRRYRGQFDSDADEFIAFIVEGAGRMRHQINDLLEYSRLSRDSKPFDKVDLNEVLQIVGDNLQNAIAESKAVITHDPLPVIKGNADQMVRLFQNLLANAIKFRRPGTAPVIEITADRDGANWVIAVGDNGIGIDKSYHEQIFTMFQRLHGRESYPGNGIGLTMCRRVAEHHGGRIWVSSEPGRGTIFSLTLPVLDQGAVAAGGKSALSEALHQRS